MPAESVHHQALTDFDWMGAIRMLSDSVARACGVTVQVLTDVDTELPFPCLQYVTHHRRLMLWSLEMAACYLASEAFDRDTVMLDADQLVYRDLSRWFLPSVDLGVLVRPLPPRDPDGFPLLNGVQFWAVRGKDRLAACYREALALAESMTEPEIAWGADTLALQRLLAPLDPIGAIVERAGLTVHFIPADEVSERPTIAQIRQLTTTGTVTHARAVVDFRNMRKRYMPTFYAATIGAEVRVA